MSLGKFKGQYGEDLSENDVKARIFAQKLGKNIYLPISITEYSSEFFENWRFYLIYLRNKSNENKILRICFRDNYETDMAFVCNFNKKCDHIY